MKGRGGETRQARRRGCREKQGEKRMNAEFGNETL
jgi:hypothetical protein